MERVTKSRVSNRSDRKSRIRVGNSKKSDSGTQKVRYFFGYRALFTPNFMFSFIRSGRVGYIPNLEKSGWVAQKNSGSGRVPENLGTRSTTRREW